MKKLLTSVAMSMLLISATALAANVHAGNKAKFDPVSYISNGPDQVITIAQADSTLYSVVQISVEGTLAPIVTTGINIKNCGNATHLDVGSSVLCTMSFDQPITFSADKKNATALGHYQIEAH